MDQGDLPKPPQGETGQASNTPISNQQQERGGFFGKLFGGRPQESQPSSEPPASVPALGVEPEIQPPTLSDITEPQPASEPVPTAQQQTAASSDSPVSPAEPRKDNTQYVPSEEKTAQLIKEHSEGDPAKRIELLTRAAILRPLLASADKFGMTNEQINTIRDYAKKAGEKEAAVIAEKLSLSTAEQIDQILLDVAKNMNIPVSRNSQGHFDSRLSPFLSTSPYLRGEINKLREAVSIRQQELMVDTNGSDVSFDAAADSVELKTDRNWNKENTYAVGTASFPSETIGRILKKLGVEPEGVDFKNFIAGLQRAGKWVEQDNLIYNARGATFDQTTNNLIKLDSNIPGMKVILYKSKDPFDRGGYTDEYRFDMVFDNQTFREMAKEPPGESIFYREEVQVEPVSAQAQSAEVSS